MRLADYFLHGWEWNPVVIAGLTIAAAGYACFVGQRGRAGCFAAALTLGAIAFLSPLNLLANGVLFSAHMAQHIILLLLVPGLFWLSLGTGFRGRGGSPSGPGVARANADCAYESWNSGRLGEPPLPRASRVSQHSSRSAILTWFLGVGSMWFWHVPQLCNAAATNSSVHAVQTVSLLGFGAAFWWPILAPNRAARLNPGLGILYLFTACLACTGLGILLTVSPVEVCPVFAAPSSAPAMWTTLRERLTAARDQQIGGLLMWMPMCLVYVAAIVLELARWLGESREEQTAALEPRPQPRSLWKHAAKAASPLGRDNV